MSAYATYDFEFALFDASSGGTQIAAQTSTSVKVRNGVFNTQLDFGAPTFQPRTDLGIRILRLDTAAYTTL